MIPAGGRETTSGLSPLPEKEAETRDVQKVNRFEKRSRSVAEKLSFGR